jgi:hypothetical protein
MLKSTPIYNHILLPQIAMFERYDDGNGFRATGKLLPFMLEEFVSRGVIDIIIQDAWRYEDTIPMLPNLLRSHIQTINNDKYYHIAREIFIPFF